MKRLAIFVEGQTEQLFVTRLLREIAGENRIDIIQEKYISNYRGRVVTAIDAVSTIDEKKYYVIIRDCGGDSFVKSDILDGYEKLCKSLGSFVKIKISKMEIFVSDATRTM